MRARAILTSTLTATAAVAALVTTPAAGAAPAQDVRPCRDAPDVPVATGAVFNNPAAGDATGVVRRICALVHQAEAGSRIRIAHFVISGDAGTDFATELIDAHRRGVDVQLVLDGWQVDNPAVDALRAELGTDASRDSWLHVCSNTSPEGNTAACIGTKGQHNKFYLFSRTGGRSNVVVQSSANFTDLNSSTYWNNATTLVGNTRLYEAYDSYFEDLAAEQRGADFDDTVTTGMRGGTVTSYFFPRATGDPIVEFLAKVGCSTGTTLRIGMSEWDTYRIAIAERVVELADRGCRVRIVRGLMDDEVAELLEGHPNIAIRTLDTSRELPGRIHSKYLLAEGAVDGDTDARWVLTGSPNFNHTSLRRNDEAMIRTNLGSLYARYRDNFEVMYAAAG
ncbi:phosphatidylserine/phosphatidylglycerophosphate/cardiolipin synthase-like enzyme [Prauserella shujinwangii]|uniref:phospholipase D n=1 Tax=Prauserella shujinwangii TaxID=1453103 RepID=A0A2T0LTU7_9PSEU|nr:phospholipase D-like domain-containing protein [Prauserella shujinwangii]PRX47162.1 phosphatidylserine/phosphatidylglycerophosphate/cardiolipin synthase-like enzyme [Prauserella shujinwangii]